MASVPSTSPLRETRVQTRFKHIPELDGVRGIAALMVVFHHLLFTSVPNPERWNWFVVLASRLAHAGGNGVDLFFVLSGFLITTLLLQDRSGPNYYWNFYWKRALRIFPLYLAALLCLIAFSPASWKYVVLAFFFIANMAQIFRVPSAGPFWTLAIEEQFYLLWPQFARRMTVEKLERFALALAVLCPMLRLIDAAFGHSNFLFTFFHCDGLALGAMLACRRTRQAVPENENLRPSVIANAIVWSAAVALIVVPLLATVTRDTYVRFASALELSGVALLSYSIVAFAVRHSGSPWLAVLRSRTLTFFGLISYCLYIANGYVVGAYDRFTGPMQVGDMRQYFVRIVCVFAASIIICLVSRYAIELPAMSLRKRVLRS